MWTQRLATYASHLTAVDAAPEVLAINRDRVDAPHVRYVQADLFAWEPPAGSFDVVFFSFWLSHVPPDRFDWFWAQVRQALRPNGRFFLIDSLREQTSTAVDHVLPDETEVVMTRRLNDGREFDIVKIFYEPGPLRTRLDGLGWNADIKGTPRFFVYGSGTRSA
jgi:demethylmenaquinone methyltransferase/2-methoxy-6-polyprenyl-1,4-benzoquinol methylase